MAERRRKRVLVIGPMPMDEEEVGGIRESFAVTLAALLREPTLQVDVHDLSVRREGRGPLRRSIGEARVLAGLLGRLTSPWAQLDAVMFNTSAAGLLRAGGAVRAACKARGIPLILRVFGGDLDLVAEEASDRARRTLERSTLRADRVLLQTHSLCERFKSAEDCRRVRWWPTTRDARARVGPSPDRARRFLYVGPIREEKGVAEAISASRWLPEGCSLSLVGPVRRGFDLQALGLGDRCTHAPALPEGGAESLLHEHDALVYPSRHRREGMPGVVVEAMQTGLPVVATRWRSLPELVVDGESGVLVPPGSAEGLGAAMRRVAESGTLYRRLQDGARVTGERFRSTHWDQRLVRWVHELVEERSARRAAPEGRRSAG